VKVPVSPGCLCIVAYAAAGIKPSTARPRDLDAMGAINRAVRVQRFP